MALLIAWIFAGIPINVLHYDVVYPLTKGPLTVPKTGKLVNPSENMPYITAQKVLSKCLQMFLLEEVSPHSPSIFSPTESIWEE